MSKNKKVTTPGKTIVVKEEKLNAATYASPVDLNDVYGTAMSREEALNQFLAAKATITRLEAENTDLKDKLKAITLKITELLLTLDFPQKITWWWALSNTSKLLTFFKGVIDIIKGK